MSTATKFILDLFYPNRCPCCDSFILWNELICDECRNSIDFSAYNKICSVCGKEMCICSDDLNYKGAVVPFRYEGVVREGLLALKRGQNKNFGEYAGYAAAEHIAEEYYPERFDMIVPVPMSESSRKKRGFNQAEIIADVISAELDIPVETNILYKEDTDISQHFLGRSGRIKNILSIKINNISLKNKAVILCDDIITTGSTVNRCAGLLRRAGASEVVLVSAAESRLK